MKTALTALLTGTLLYAGCAVGPEYSRPETSSPSAFSQMGAPEAPTSEHWWELYEDPTLTNLIEIASTRNHNLEALYQRTLQARALIVRSKADGRPQLNANAGYERFQNSDETSDGAGLNESLYSGGLTLGWELDLFGRVSQLVQSAQADALASEAAYRDLLLITQTDVAITYYRLRAVIREIEALERSVETRRESYEIVRDRFESGSVSDLDLAQAETLLAVSEADLAQLQRSQASLKHALAVLTGQPAPNFELAADKIEGVPT